MEMQALPGSQTEGAFHKSVTPGEALLSEVQGCEDNTELGGERDGSPGWKDSLSLGPQEVRRPPGRGDREAAGPEDSVMSDSL